MSEILDALAAYLHDSAAERSLARLAVESRSLVAGHVYCCIHPWSAPVQRSKSTSGWGASMATRPRANLLIGPLSEGLQAGVRMDLDRGRWHFSPTVQNGNQASGLLVPLNDPWSETLCRLSSNVLTPFLQFQPKSQFSARGILNEVNARMERFKNLGPFEFFSRSGEAFAWIAASGWPDWDRKNLSTEKRIARLQRFVYTPIDVSMFQKIRPEAVATQLRQGKAKLPELQCKKSQFEEMKRRSRIGRQFNYWPNAERAMESKGDGQKFRPMRIKLSKNLTDEADKHYITTGHWWWRFLKTSPDFFSEFINKWEASAFFYEFRARKMASSITPHWDWFRLSWIQLDYTQKAIVYYLYHDRDVPVKSVSAPTKSSSSTHKAVVRVNLENSLDEVLSQVRNLWTTYHIWDSSESQNSPDLPSKWGLLEKMDRDRFLNRKGVFNGSDLVTLKREEIKYAKACKNAGLI